ncbi:hypothetical protein DLM78_05190 [Leptospira stimsonii]|uniref:Uncharacterized protein n=1 Tax=Leptospira stimsonii TaxID=2202203 RepID=A0A8B3CWP3_9LEPT|nr:hypothetical protein DLM78_05190 [Leptospira stimsonii]
MILRGILMRASDPFFFLDKILRNFIVGETTLFCKKSRAPPDFGWWGGGRKNVREIFPIRETFSLQEKNSPL